jgi:hypothetical protein
MLQERGHIFLIFAIAILVSIFVIWLSGRYIDSMLLSEKRDFAKYVSGTTLAMVAIDAPIFVKTHDMYKNNVEKIYIVEYKKIMYANIFWVSTLTLVSCAITGLFSMLYFITAIDKLLIVALCISLSAVVLLVSIVLIFCVYTLR